MSHYLEAFVLTGALCFQIAALSHMPRNIRLLIADLESSGFALVAGGKGSHRKSRHAKFPGAVVLSGKDGDDAQPYQEKQIRNAIHEASR